MRSTHSLLISVLLIFSFAATAGAQAPAEQPDARALRRDIRVFAGVVDTTMRDTAPEPFGLLSGTRGAYLPDFGLVFNLEVNLVSLRVRSPFDPRPLSREELDQALKLKKKRMVELEDRLSHLLADYASNIELRDSDRVAVIVHLFNYPEEDSESLPAGLIAEVSRHDLAEYKKGKLAYADFAKRVEMVKF